MVAQLHRPTLSMTALVLLTLTIVGHVVVNVILWSVFIAVISGFTVSSVLARLLAALTLAFLTQLMVTS